MRCSLLTLSTYVDGELEPRKRGELEAHLVGCQRCSRGIAYLHEETERIAMLGRVRVADQSVHALLRHVGLLSAGQGLPRRIESDDDMSRPVHEIPPWLAATESGKALPWAPRREARGELTVAPEDDPDIQPLLPFDAIPPAQRGRGDHVELTGLPASPEVEAVPHHPIPDPPAADAGGGDDVPPIHPAPVPPLLDDDFDDEIPVAPGPMRAAQPPSLIERLRDAVALRLALTRGARRSDDDIEIVSGAGAPVHSRAARFAAARPPQPAAPAPAPAPVIKPLPEPLPELPPDPFDDLIDHLDDAEVPVAPAWPEPAPEPAPRPVDHYPPAREEIEVEAYGRLWAGQAPAAPGDRPGDRLDEEIPPAAGAAPVPTPAPNPALGRHRSRLEAKAPRLSVPRPHLPSMPSMPSMPAMPSIRLPRLAVPGGMRQIDRRSAAAIASVAVLLVAGLVVGRSAASPRPTASSGVSTAPVGPGVVHVTGPSAAPAVPSAAPFTLDHTIALGSGPGGFQIQGIRYGSHPNDFRIVFDMSGSGSAPPVQVGLAGPNTLAIVFTGVTAKGTPEVPPAGAVVTGATIVRPSPVSGALVYEFPLARGVTIKAIYVGGPVRLVIDLS